MDIFENWVILSQSYHISRKKKDAEIVSISNSLTLKSIKKD